ncbi:MAG: hypothetical protein GY786_02445, partial [Proteobacteria bacterium]|nr:hypothetical protein [Pseudomonadota bacterium]
FHHQYKHTLAELNFGLEEKKEQLISEISFLDNPDNKEAAYAKLLDQVTTMFLDELKAKEQNIESLIAEEKEIQQKVVEYKSKLERLLRQEIPDDELNELLMGIAERLEEMKIEILKSHNQRKKELSQVFTPYIQFNNAIVVYFDKVQNYAGLFQKALWIHQKQQLFEKIKLTCRKLAQLPPEKLKQKIGELRGNLYDSSKVTALENDISQFIKKIGLQLKELKKLRIRNLFSKKGMEKGDLIECLKYFEGETKILIDGINKLQTSYLQMNNLQNSLFKKQGELISNKIQSTKNGLLIEVGESLLKNPNDMEMVEKILQFDEPVPKEIKEELNQLRSKLNESIVQYKKVTIKQNLTKIRDYKDLYKRANRRHNINETAKELVNFRQGLDAIAVEIVGEKKDLAYLKTQEDQLESFVMSKTLPSTKVLLKTQYLPLVEQDLKLLERANLFLGEILSKGEELSQQLSNTYFNNRYNYQQFGFGNYCYDSSRSTRNYTEKNIAAALMMLAENYKVGFSSANTTLNRVALKKIEVVGLEGVQSAIKTLWQSTQNEKFLFLPATLTMEEALYACNFKEVTVKENPKISRSRNSLILIYIGVINFDELSKNETQLEEYHLAIMSNIFISIDDVKTFNNKQSIFEAIIGHTLGNCHDDISKQIYQKFLYDS